MGSSDTKWAYKHRARIRFALITIGIVALAVYSLVSLYEPPTCFDGKRNQDEVGADCGGPCQFYCASQAQDTRVAWAREFEVSPGWYSALAYVENPNVDKYAEQVPYRFSVYDETGALILKREGQTYLYRDPLVVVFEGRLATGSSVPASTVFEWLAEPQWQQAPRSYEVVFEEQRLVRVGRGHELTVTVYNKEPVLLRDVEVVAIVYDTEENAQAVSQTYLDMISARTKKRATFAWPQEFPATTGRVEFIARIPRQE